MSLRYFGEILSIILFIFNSFITFYYCIVKILSLYIWKVSHCLSYFSISVINTITMATFIRMHSISLTISEVWSPWWHTKGMLAETKESLYLELQAGNKSNIGKSTFETSKSLSQCYTSFNKSLTLICPNRFTIWRQKYSNIRSYGSHYCSNYHGHS